MTGVSATSSASVSSRTSSPRGCYVMIAGGLLDDHRQPRRSLTAESAQQPPVVCGPALGSGDQQLGDPLRAQPHDGEHQYRLAELRRQLDEREVGFAAAYCTYQTISHRRPLRAS